MVALSLDDGYWGRMTNVAFLPAVIVFMLFIVHFGLTQLVCALGPVAHMQVLWWCNRENGVKAGYPPFLRVWGRGLFLS